METTSDFYSIRAGTLGEGELYRYTHLTAPPAFSPWEMKVIELMRPWAQALSIDTHEDWMQDATYLKIRAYYLERYPEANDAWRKGKLHLLVDIEQATAYGWTIQDLVDCMLLSAFEQGRVLLPEYGGEMNYLELADLKMAGKQ